jgi:hypothetical protein
MNMEQPCHLYVSALVFHPIYSSTLILLHRTPQPFYIYILASNIFC